MEKHTSRNRIQCDLFSGLQGFGGIAKYASQCRVVNGSSSVNLLKNSASLSRGVWVLFHSITAFAMYDIHIL